MGKGVWHTLLVCSISASSVAANGTARAQPGEVLQRLAAEQGRLIQQQQDHINALERLNSAARRLPGSGGANGTMDKDTLERIRAEVVGHSRALDHIWVVISAAVLIFVQAGFALLEVGSCRAITVQTVLLKNLTSLCVSALCWFFLGFAFAYGGPLRDTDSDDSTVSHSTELTHAGQKFIGWNYFASRDFSRADADGNFSTTDLCTKWFSQWVLCAVSTTIASSGVAERAHFVASFVFSVAMASAIYPVGVAWTWGQGWLAGDEINDVGFMDYAGSGVIHMVGGVGALAGAVIGGPRNGRWLIPEAFAPHSMWLIVIGTLIIWFCSYCANCGASFGLHDERAAHKAALVAMNTTLSPAVAGLSALILKLLVRWYDTGLFKYDVRGACNGIICGLVSITASCSNVEPGAAMCIGFIGAAFYVGTSALLVRLRVDDPVDTFAVHGACGFWGVLAAALFDHGTGLKYVNGWSGFECQRGADGACGELWGQLLAANILLIVCLASWSAAMSVCVLGPLRLAGLIGVGDVTLVMAFDETTPRKAYALDHPQPAHPIEAT